MKFDNIFSKARDQLLWELVKDLPASVPEASEFNKLTLFGGKLEPEKARRNLMTLPWMLRKAPMVMM